MVEVIQQQKHLPQQLSVDCLNNKGTHFSYISKISITLYSINTFLILSITYILLHNPLTFIIWMTECKIKQIQTTLIIIIIIIIIISGLQQPFDTAELVFLHVLPDTQLSTSKQANNN